MTIQDTEPERLRSIALYFFGRAVHYRRRAMMYKVFYRWQRSIHNI